MIEGWEIKKLIEVCENLDSKRVPITKNKRITGDIPYYGASGIVDYVEKYLFDENLLLISEDGANLLARTYPIAFSISGKTWVNNHAHVLQFKEITTQKFIEYYFNSINLDDYISGMAQPKLNQKSLNSIPIPIPSLEEQKQIIAILDKAFAAIDQAKVNIEQNIQNTKELFQSKLNEIFSQKGEGWEKKKLGGICERVSVGHVGATTKFYTENDGVAFIRSQNVRRGFIDLSNVRYITKEFHLKSKKSQLKKGDILFVRVGANRGDCATLTQETGDLNCANIVFARPISENSKFIEYYFLSPLGTKSLLGLTTGSAQGVINTKSIEQTYINFPSEKEQEMIVKKIEFIKVKMNDIENKYNKKLESLKDLKKSLLQKAFAGALTSPEGTTDIREGYDPSVTTTPITPTKQNPERVL